MRGEKIKLKRIIRFSSYFISFPYFPHFLNSCNQNTILLNLFVFRFCLCQWLEMYFCFKRLSQHFFPCPGLTDYFFLWWQPARSVPWLLLGAAESEQPGSLSEDCLSVVFFLLLTFEHMWKGELVHNFCSASFIH